VYQHADRVLAFDLYVQQACGVCLFQKRMVDWGLRVEEPGKKVAEVRGMWNADEVLEA
jgi:hypothetical protein